MNEKTDNLGGAENLGWIDDELREFQTILETEMEEKLRESVLAGEHTRQRLSLMEEETFRQVEGEWMEKENILLHREGEIRKETALFTESLKSFLADNTDVEELLEKTWTDLTGGVLS